MNLRSEELACYQMNMKRRHLFGRWAYRWRRFVDFVLPPRCAGCNRTGAAFCSRCVQQVRWMMPPLCPHCGRIFAHGRACHACRRQPLVLDRIRAATLFASPLSKVIHAFKYENRFGLADPLGDLMAAAWPRWMADTAVDLVLPIPLHPDREKERGYNQAYLLARVLALHIERPLGPPTAVRRTRYTQPQARLSAIQRRENMSRAFVADPVVVSDLNVLLVDDVSTTGATLDAAAQALVTAGATAVSAYCLARAT